MTDLTYHAPLDDFAFFLREICGLESVLGLPAFTDFSPELIASVFDEAGKFAATRLSPLNRSGDLQGCKLEADGRVILPEGFAEAYRDFVAQGWNAASFPPEVGGQGIPYIAAGGLSEIWHGANLSFALTPLLTHSAVHLLMHYGDHFARAHILPKLVSGEWTGVMCLTEPQAGSDVGACRALATPQADGSYRLKGSKIFISCGDHEASENIIHMVLARLPDAPEGTAGLSLFMVPKFRVNEDGSIGERNDVKAVSLEHKLGMHASPTAVMAYGDDEGAYATLIGEPHAGLKAMFIMMNSARLAVGLEGLGIAGYATQLATQYANERVQGRQLAGGSKEPVTIDQHADVKRMLTGMQSHVSALRALALYSGRLVDEISHHGDETVRNKAKARLDLLTPIVKAHTTNLAFHIASEAVQVFGGLGYIEETGIAQLLRDVRVSMIYEGTNGIQALDLAGRKLPAENGAALGELAEEITQVAKELADSNDYALMPLGKALAGALKNWREASRSMLLQVQHTLNNSQGEAPFGASAAPYLSLSGLVVEGWFMGQAALRASALLKENSDAYPQTFLKDKLAQARFFMLDTLLDTASLKERVLLGDSNLRQTGPGGA